MLARIPVHRVQNQEQMLLKEIGAKWTNKFSADELSALKSKDDLISQVVAKYQS